MMPCSDCKHWRNRNSTGELGVCVRLTEHHRTLPKGQHPISDPYLVTDHKTLAHRKKRQHLIQPVINWRPATDIHELDLITYTAGEFFCALHDRDKRRKTKLPVVVNEVPQGTTPRRYQVILEEEDA